MYTLAILESGRSGLIGRLQDAPLFNHLTDGERMILITGNGLEAVSVGEVARIEARNLKYHASTLRAVDTVQSVIFTPTYSDHVDGQAQAVSVKVHKVIRTDGKGLTPKIAELLELVLARFFTKGLRLAIAERRQNEAEEDNQYALVDYAESPVSPEQFDLFSSLILSADFDDLIEVAVGLNLSIHDASCYVGFLVRTISTLDEGLLLLDALDFVNWLDSDRPVPMYTPHDGRAVLLTAEDASEYLALLQSYTKALRLPMSADSLRSFALNHYNWNRINDNTYNHALTYASLI